ncbi:helix-turn-helix transcriptional regulator [Asticcacaulis sp. ZE23SCel15]|uniref:helix-turn-helix domain-containing protein n=1 Tax=Asticcacaulis sp. ZE23SCel15 TaxID=3059027 RepID=UPI00265E32E9|nr:helix-turn-helix transcriptional regulator [Asticcacaulis sp. ZE23SCel15]WKL56110.1 helix-turn-helix transcriptional regulator [Asticcacaulis sp. ZE23SCel15]
MARQSDHPVDIYVGARIKACRKTSGISQTELAKAVDLTFQQVQKYESGSNRVSASVLFDMSRFLGVQIGYFFDGYDVWVEKNDPRPELDNRPRTFTLTGEGADIADAFPKIKEPAQRRKIAELVRILAGEP